MFAQRQVESQSPVHEEVSRVVRMTLPGVVATGSEPRSILERLDGWAALAVLALASSGVPHAANWLLENWQLR